MQMKAMKYTKHVVADDMNLCYAIGMFDGSDEKSFLIGVEKQGPIRRFGLDGHFIETVTEGPGGVMTITQAPGRDDQVLATSKFFSPNFGADEAEIVVYTRSTDGTWQETTLCELPYVHRFGILKGKDNTTWLIACTIKSGCREVKEDWYIPGAVYVAPLEGKLERYSKTNQLTLQKIADYQLQNHGFYTPADKSFALLGTAAGVFSYVPPEQKGASWHIHCLAVQPTSDMCLVDLDQDGKEELVTISRFHGDTLRVWRLTGEVPGRYELVWTDPEKRGFLHAIWATKLFGEPAAILGNRKDKRDLFRLCYDGTTYVLEFIDHDRGPTNCCVFEDEQGPHIIATNRETNEVALYDVQPADVESAEAK